MPCWFYEKKDLRLTPSLKEGLSPDVEARYRREGARFIIDSGTKMGLRYDTCATGVVYFHRFYMFHSFREFHRYVTAACCLFLAGKVEETPKKCKDIIKITRSMLTEAQFAVFGDDPREEVMTMERCLLQTIKFDLMVEHPYAYLLKLAKMVRGDKDKTQKLVQMAWTFVNDSLCTMLCLQWEPDIIAVALMYLASRLTKVEVTDWHGKVPGQKVKWYEALVEDATLEILEDVCHQVLDLYSTTPQASREDSPPPPPPPPKTVSSSPAPTKTPTKRSRSPSPVKAVTKSSRQVSPARQQPITPNFDHRSHSAGKPIKEVPAPVVATATSIPGQANAPVMPSQTPVTSYMQHNPYLNSQMYSSSFLSSEGSNAIQTLIGRQPAAAAAQAPAQQAPYVAVASNSHYSAAVSSSQYSAPQQPQAVRNPVVSYSSTVYTQQQQQPAATQYSSSGYTAQQQVSAPVSYPQTQYSTQPASQQQQQPYQHQYTSYPPAPVQQHHQQQAAAPQQQSYTSYPSGSQHYTSASAYPTGGYTQQHPPAQQQQQYNHYGGNSRQQPPPVQQSRGHQAMRMSGRMNQRR